MLSAVSDFAVCDLDWHVRLAFRRLHRLNQLRAFEATQDLIAGGERLVERSRIVLGAMRWREVLAKLPAYVSIVEQCEAVIAARSLSTN